VVIEETGHGFIAFAPVAKEEEIVDFVGENQTP
jgi:hypothetical protein